MKLITRTMQCACGEVQFAIKGPPILSAICYCDDCQSGGKILEAIPHAKPVLEPDKGTSYLTYRDDRLTCLKGANLLEGHKLTPKAPTTRYITTCCKTAMYLKFKYGHWTSTYRNSFTDADLPKIEMLTNLRRRTSTDPLPDDTPQYQRFPLRLFGKLIKARIDMALGR